MCGRRGEEEVTRHKIETSFPETNLDLDLKNVLVDSVPYSLLRDNLSANCQHYPSMFVVYLQHPLLWRLQQLVFTPNCWYISSISQSATLLMLSFY